MSVITYTALREFEATGYTKTATDISAARADDSINGSSLAGLLADQWVLVSGFVDADNNGWFQAKIDSTAGKITLVTPPVSHLRLPGVAGNYASTPDSAANSVVGSLELIACVTPEDWTPAGVQTLAAKWNTTGNQRSYALSINAAGTLNLSWSVDGTAVISKNSTVATGLTDRGTKYIRATLNVNNGAAGNDVKFYTSDDGVVWTQLGATVTTAGVTSVFNSTAVFEVGSINSGTSQLFVGRISIATLINGLAGTTAASFNVISNGTRGSLTLPGPAGETWTVAQSGSPAALLQGRALIDAAAGPSISLIGYKRGLGQTYSMEFGAERLDRSVKVARDSKKPMGGGPPEVLLHHHDVYHGVTTIVQAEAAMPQWRELLASLEGGEAFIFDRYGTIAAPVLPVTATMSEPDYSEAREGSTFRYRISFEVCEA